MWLPFISKIDKLEKEKIELQLIVRDSLHFVQSIMKKHGEFILNPLGSGENTYKISGKLFEFNEFSHKHQGFFIDDKRVTLKEFIDKAQINVIC